MELTKENVVLLRDSMNNPDNQQFLMLQSSNIAQENTFLIQQAMYIAQEIPQLVSPVELNTIAVSNFNSGDLPNVEKYYLLAIEKSSDPYFQTLAVRSYASFLFRRGGSRTGGRDTWSRFQK